MHYKRQDIEFARIISAYAIVWFHAQAPGRPVAYGGLIVFVLLSMYLGGEKRFSAVTLGQRVVRILIPWVVWFLIYGLVNVFIHRRGIIPLDGGVIAGVLSGTRIHLWYMPFIFFCLVAADAARAVVSRRGLLWCSVAAYAAILSATVLWRPASLAAPTPSEQYAHAAAAVFLGVYLANSTLVTQRVKFAVAAGMGLVTLAAWPHPLVAIPYLVGLVVGVFLTTG